MYPGFVFTSQVAQLKAQYESVIIATYITIYNPN